MIIPEQSDAEVEKIEPFLEAFFQQMQQTIGNTAPPKTIPKKVSVRK